MFGLGMQELMLLGVVAIMLFGKNLPGVAKQLGSSYREFRKGLWDLQSSLNFDDDASSSSRSKPAKSYTATSYDDYDDYEAATAPKFEPPPSEPTVKNAE
jgi:sec-independent protein translocase protein TatA